MSNAKPSAPDGPSAFSTQRSEATETLLSPVLRPLSSAPSIARVALAVPLPRLFDYRVPPEETLTPEDIGRRVRVGFGTRSRIGIIVGLADSSELPAEQLRPLEAVLRDLPALPADWFRLTEFCASY
ncbi:MAG: hypothetical protein LBQ62_01865, partial [Candidatus Accumulibacter sp.]|nr:hypothetical protein [Accumulibacter sp.]